MVNSNDVPGTVGRRHRRHDAGADVPATPATFAPFAPGVGQGVPGDGRARRITSTAGDAALTVHDPATTGIGRLVNGTSTLTNPLQVFATATQGTAGRAARSAAPRLRPR